MLIEGLKMFCDTVDLNSFSKAAEANFVTQSAVSHQVRSLEKSLKNSLIERGSKTISLTKAGELFYKEAKIILEHFERLKNQLDRANKTVSGNIRVATIHGVGLHELPPYIKQFMKSHSRVGVQLEYMRDEKVYEAVAKRRVDFGIVSFPVSKPGIKVWPFREDRLDIVCHPAHPLAKYKKVALSRLEGLNFIAFDKGIPTRKVVDKILQKNNVTVKIPMVFDNIETLKKAIEIDAGVSILPSVTVQNEIEHKTLKSVLIAGKPPVRPLGILMKINRVPSMAASKFIELLLNYKP